MATVPAHEWSDGDRLRPLQVSEGQSERASPSLRRVPLYLVERFVAQTLVCEVARRDFPPWPRA